MQAPENERVSTVLLVDDDKSTRHLVGAKLIQKGYDVLQADSSRAGLKILDEAGYNSFDLVISDYWMPGGNGLEFLKSVRHKDSTLSVILMTADGERQILENLVQFGECGFLQKPIALKALDEVVPEAILKTQMQRHLKATEIQANTLGENQRVLLKNHLDAAWPGIEFSFSAKSQASGDFASAITTKDGNKTLILSDSSGHELASSIQSNYFHGLARGMLVCGSSIEDVFDLYNETLIKEWNKNTVLGHSLAACAIRFDRDQNEIYLVNAGFPAPMMAGLNGFATPLGEEAGAPPLGWFEEEYRHLKAPLSQGSLTNWTDGLEDLATDLKVDPLALADRLLDHSQDNTVLQSKSIDDIAVVRLKTPSTPANANVMLPILYQRYHGGSLEQIDAIQNYCEKSLRYSIPDLDAGYLSEMLVCVREALINALLHGCEKREDRWATLQMSRSEDRSKIMIQIQDEGKGHSFDWETHAADAAENLLTEHRGLIMIQAIPTRTEIQKNGAHLIMEFERTPLAPQHQI
ncbi:response regulator [Pelagicoccus albus]|uniref:Response regulator n=1 Tax=Pelagicoccus albus TaxID=415222 RepID=A0A7X1E8W2_9BACT|nr:response regulator [Pelagicoccus albus]MBC2607175.1 response regulator [Pelagicoccus albus]